MALKSTVACLAAMFAASVSWAAPEGYRLVSVATNEAHSFGMPSGAVVVGNWHRRGAFRDWLRLDMGGFAFPLGTNECTSFSVFVDGRIRPRPRDREREICAVGTPMLAMQGASSLVVREGRLAWGFVLGGGVLVADQLLPVPFISDALFVQTDPGREPVLARGFAIAPGVPGVLVVNGHDNAGESYRSHSVVAFERGRLSPVYEGPDLYSATFPDRGCEARAHSQVLGAMRPLGSRHGGRADIAVTVTEAAECLSDDGVPPLPARTFAFTLKWDARRGAYRGGSPALDALNDRRRGD